jgi:hypothetical protein
MFNKFRRKLAKLIAPKPVKRVKKNKVQIEFIEKYKEFDRIMNDKSYHQYKRNKQATVVGGE